MVGTRGGETAASHLARLDASAADSRLWTAPGNIAGQGLTELRDGLKNPAQRAAFDTPSSTILAQIWPTERGFAL
jgi:hypothetical protein